MNEAEPPNFVGYLKKTGYTTISVQSKSQATKRPIAHNARNESNTSRMIMSHWGTRDESLVFRSFGLFFVAI